MKNRFRQLKRLSGKSPPSRVGGLLTHRTSFLLCEWHLYLPHNKHHCQSGQCCQPVQQGQLHLLERVYETMVLLLAKMKELAVITIHKTIHMVHLWKMNLESGESVRAFAARITGKADLCDLTIACTKEGCDTKVPYRDEVVLQVLLQGMNDQDI